MANFREIQKISGGKITPHTSIQSSNSSKFVYTSRNFWHISVSFVCQIAFDWERVHSITSPKRAELTTHQNAFLDH